MTGSGTAVDPYVIYDVNDLQAMQGDLAAFYELANNIDCSGIANFEPIGGWGGAANFTGSFDGKNRTIFNLVVNRITDDEIGLFGNLDGATVSNLRIEGSFTGDDNVGGLAGGINGGIVTNCSTNVTVVGDTSLVGGFAGLIYGGAIITDSHSEGTVDEGAGVFNNYGGFAGWIGQDAIVTRCYSTVDVTAPNADYVGGFVGYVSATTISKSFSTGSVQGNSIVGGFIGQGAFGANITAILSDCYSTGAVHGVVDASGFCSSNGDWATSILHLVHCYATGAVTCDAGASPAEVAGFFYNQNAGTVNENACFWDVTSTGVANSLYGTGKTTSQMKDVNTFQNAGWAIQRIWNVLSYCNGGYPCLIGVNICCAPTPIQTDLGENKVVLEAIRNLEMVYGARAYIDKSGNFTWESRHHRNA